jgi:hypothetical protein
MLDHELVGRDAGLILGDDLIDLYPVGLALERSAMDSGWLRRSNR